MAKDEGNYERFKFTAEQLVELKALLGPSQSVEQFLCNVEGCINQAVWVRDNDKYAPVTLRQMKNRLHKYEQLCTAFVQAVSVIDADLSKPNLQVGEIDWPAILQIEAATFMDVNDCKQEFTDGYVSQVVDSVRTLGNLCKIAKDNVPPPRKGDLSSNETMVQMFEDGIIDAYLSAFGSYPAKTNGGAFHEALNTFYRCAGYSESNSFQRMWKAIDRVAESLAHNPIP
tara:strand:- start:15355 stop:16038 length:684 start_codon:yes stop_codon:yes gene_type:complete